MRKIYLLILIITLYNAYSQETMPINGVESNFYPIYAFTNAHIIISSEESIENGTLLIKGDKILDVGESIEIPESSIIKDLDGGYIYPSFIDLFANYGMPVMKEKSWSPHPQYKSSKNGAFHWNEAIHPELNASKEFIANGDQSKRYLSSGFGVVLTHMQNGIVRGTGCLVSLSNQNEQKTIIKEEAASFFSFKKGNSKQKYPTSLMGSIALLRQLFLDAEWYEKSKQTANLSYQSFNNQKDLPKIFESHDVLDYNRIVKIGDEFEIDFIIKGNGKEYEQINDLKEYNVPIILPLNFPEKYNVENPESFDILTLSKLKHWETAPFNAKILSNNEISFCFTMDGIKTAEEFLKKVRIIIATGLSKNKVLNALTIYPAKLIGEEKSLGTLTKNKKANFIICSGDVFEDGKIYENWANGEKYVVEEKSPVDLRGFYTMNSYKINDNFSITGDVNSPSMKWITKDSTYKLTFSQEKSQIIFSDKKGRIKAIGYAENDKIEGYYQDIKGTRFNFILNKDSIFESKSKEYKLSIDSVIPEIWTPNKSYGVKEPPISYPTIFTNATIWTNENEGILENADIAINNGKILEVSKKIKKEKYPNYTIIDATGKHITSGIIDEHSHIAISRGVNEASQSVTAEVRIGDVINPKDHNIYRQLAGGVTACQLLHGSANPIGGQSAIIKLRWGSSAEEMKIQGAVPFIKFALGENVKQSNWGDYNKIRFPQTRMGVEQVFYDAFYRAKQYKKEWDEYKSLSYMLKRKTNPPREDLELNALSDILDSKMFITCHSYIQSEINMLMHVADSMNFTVNTFTHILEGYKLAEKLKNHSAGASTFSDWWAYKFEVNDAIPYNAAILHKKGVVTAINSDDAEMGRRLNQEAAKAIKYGETSEEDAWKMITLNPAILLHLDHKMGSLKSGKDADIVIWSQNPLSVYAIAEKTYIDGKLLFDINRNDYLMKRDHEEKVRIINKMMNDTKNDNYQEVHPEEEKIYHCETIDE